MRTFDISHQYENLFGDEDYVPARAEDWPEFAALVRRLAQRQTNTEESREGIDALRGFAARLESRIAERGQAKGVAAPGSKKKPKRR